RGQHPPLLCKTPTRPSRGLPGGKQRNGTQAADRQPQKNPWKSRGFLKTWRRERDCSARPGRHPFVLRTAGPPSASEFVPDEFVEPRGLSPSLCRMFLHLVR